ncbi:MAG: pitrilysin family protein, partial [Candidatus Izemoplasmatales bacterium]
MMLKVTEYPTFKETVISKKLASGLNVVILPKSGFVRKSATLVVPFGSLSHKVKLSETEGATFPPGTAHFLEHMLFETTHENNSRKFALLGASVNAYTTYNRTAVYFSTTNGFVETLTVMFDMIMSASFTEEGIAKERAIIEKEILLYRDEPEQQLYYDLIKLMYPNHPIHYDIAGSEETIKEIDKELLKKAYAAFYHPQAMLLVLSGDFAIEETLFAI